jgi:hypothetical protein
VSFEARHSRCSIRRIGGVRAARGQPQPGRQRGTGRARGRLLGSRRRNAERPGAGVHLPVEVQRSLQPDSRSFSAACEPECVADDVEPDCSDFDHWPRSSAPPTPPATRRCAWRTRRSRQRLRPPPECAVAGLAHVDIEGERVPRGDGRASVPRRGMRRRLRDRNGVPLDIAPVMATSGLGTFDDPPGSASPPATTRRRRAAAARSAPARWWSRRASATASNALATDNADVVNIRVGFGSMGPMCSLNGSLVGSADPASRCERRPDGRSGLRRRLAVHRRPRLLRRRLQLHRGGQLPDHAEPRRRRGHHQPAAGCGRR